MIKDLVKLFNIRDAAFSQATIEISKKIDFVYEAITEFLNESPHNIMWDSVEVSSSNMVVIVAHIVDDMPMSQLTEPTPSSPSKLLTIGIPFDILKDSSKDDVLKFLEEMDRVRRAKRPTPASNLTLSELVDSAEAGEDLDLLLGDNQTVSKALIELLRADISTEYDPMDDFDTHQDRPISSYKKRTLH